MAKKERRLALWRAGNTLCPLCLTEFSEHDATSAVAEVEHSPPLKAGGPHICVLTCATCNRQAGSSIDKAAIQALTDEHDGMLSTTKGTISVKLGRRPRPIGRGLLTFSHPNADDTLYVRPTRRQELPLLPTDGFGLSWGTRSQRLIEIGLLKAAYLAVFSLLGVEFAKARALRKVRQQIAQPAETLLANFCLRSERTRSRAVCLVYRGGTTCWGVILDSFLVLIPSLDDDTWAQRDQDPHSILKLKQFTHTFGASRDVMFPALTQLPVTALGEQFAQAFQQVGSLGWELRVEGNGIEEHFVSLGRRANNLLLLNVYRH